MSDLQWTFELYDKMSKKADAITASLEKLDRTLGSTKKETGALQNMFGGFSGPIGTLVGGMKEAAGAILEVGRAVGGLTYGFGEALLSAMAFKDSTLISFKAMLGDEQAADALWERSVLFAKYTPFSTGGTAAMMKQILGGGFKGQEAEDIFAGMADMAAMSGSGEAGMQSVLTQLVEGKAMGKFQQRHLMPILNSLGMSGGGGAEAFYKQMAGSTGMSAEEVQKKISSGEGEFKAADVIAAWKQVVFQNVDKGQGLGFQAMAQGQSIGGLMNTLQSMFFNEGGPGGGGTSQLFSQINMTGSGVAGVRSFLGNLVDVFTKLTLNGGRFSAIMNSVIDKVGTFLGTISGDKISGWIDALLDAGQELYDDLTGDVKDAMQIFNDIVGEGSNQSLTLKDVTSGLHRAFELLANVLATVVGLMAKAYKGYALLADVDWKFLWNEQLGMKYSHEGSGVSPAVLAVLKAHEDDTLTQALANQAALNGKTVTDGFVKGIATGLPAVSSSASDMALTSHESAAEALQSHSPSRLFERLGGYVAEGFSMGIDGGSGQVAGSIAGMLGSPQATVSFGAGGRGGRSLPPVELHVHVDGRGEDAEGLARRLSELLPDELNKLFTRLAIETGES